MVQLVAELDHQLASHSEFGSSSAILDRSALFYRLALKSLPELSPVAERVWTGAEWQQTATLTPLLRDPVLRLAIHEALRTAAGKPPLSKLSASELLQELAAASAYDWRSLPEREMRSYRLAYGTTTAVWTARRPYEVSLQRLVEQFEQECLPNRLVGTISNGEIVPASSELVELTDDALRLLFQLMPHTTQSVMRHAHILAWARIHTHEARMESGSTRTIPGMLLLSPDDVNTPWRAAEAVLHEAAHLKLFDLYLTSAILAASYNAMDSMRIEVPWNPSTSLQSNAWPADQALAALHVYVHLAVLALAGRNTASVGMEAGPLLEKALYRAEFLARELRELEPTPFGPRGRAFVLWLQGIVTQAKGLTQRGGAASVERSSYGQFLEDGPGRGLAWSPTRREIVILGERVVRLLHQYCESAGQDAEATSALALVGLLPGTEGRYE